MKILNVINTPFELYYLSSVAGLLLERDKNLEIKLLIRQELEDKITPEIKSLYSEIKVVEFPTLSFPLDKNPIRTFYNFLKNFYQTIRFRNYLKKINFDFDIICISSFREFFANMLCRQVPSGVRLVALRMANQRTPGLKYEKKPVLTFLMNLKNLFFCYSPINYKWRTDFKNLVEKNFIKYPYHRTISITDYNIGRDKSDYRLPPPFIALKKIYKVEEKDQTPGILIAGERTPLHPSWGEEDQKKYEEFLDCLRTNFKKYKLYFKPRKVFGNTKGEVITDLNAYNLEGFQIIPADIPLEEICLKKQISKVISIKSTSSKVGVYFGIPSYLLYPMFNLPEDFKLMTESYFNDIQSIIKVNKFEDLMIQPSLFIKKYSFDTLSSLYWKAIIK